MQLSSTVRRNLAFIAVFIFTVCTLTGAEKVSPCCVTVSKSRLNDIITGFRLQPMDLPCVKAVIFYTERGQFCSDPAQFWVKRKVLELRNFQRNKTSPTSAPPHSTISGPQTSTGSS